MVPKPLKGKVKPYYDLKDDAPTAADKASEAAMAADLMKEDFYGKKKIPEKLEKMGKEAINKRKVEELTKKMRQAPKGVIFRSVTIQKKP